MAKDERAERLAAALRENLKRRKAQTRLADDVHRVHPSTPPPGDEQA